MKKIPGFMLLALVCLVSPVYAASIAGDTVNVKWFFPSLANLFSNLGNVTVPGSVTAGFGAGKIQVNDGTITIQNNTQGWTGSSGFNGFIFTDVTEVPNFSSFTLSSIASLGGPLPPLDPILSFNSDQLSVNFNPNSSNNLGPGATGQLYTFSFTEGPTVTPEPSTLFLLASGLVGLAGVARSKMVKNRI